ncbi:amidase signature domain-containing protein [Xylariaceae sp. FL1272]|nr:amidase signature domain-containing protein [Xylariaceae sp. FL1272]
MSSSAFKPFATTGTEAQQLLQSHELTSVQLVEQCLAQIEQHEAHLNALISVAPRHLLISAAEALDMERVEGRVRGPLHGIPIILKDNFITSSELGMTTTAGCWALASAKSSRNSAMAQTLLDGGMIILAKANMTEFAGMKVMSKMMPGWSAYGGQTFSAYVPNIEPNETLLGHSAPGGSSTGSAVGVAAGYAPLAIGAETVGSIVTPASRAALYAIKPTVGIVDTTGAYCLTDFYDSAGPMAKSTRDLIPVCELLLNRKITVEGELDMDDLKVGFLDPRKWTLTEEICRQHDGTAEEMVERYEECLAGLRKSGCNATYPVTLAAEAALLVNGQSIVKPVAFWEFKNICIPRFLSFFDESPVRTLGELIKYNEKHKEKAMPEPVTGQDDLIQAEAETFDQDHVAFLRAKGREVAQHALDDAFEQQGIDMIAAPTDSSLCVYAAQAGYPLATMPLGQLSYNNRPFGLCMVAKAGREESLLRFMAFYEECTPARPIPHL